MNDERLAIPTLDPATAIAAGIVLIPGDRQNTGAIGTLSLTDNVTMPVLGSAYRPWLLQRADMHRRTRRLGEDFEVRPNRPEGNFDALSGGNQQKALLAKWLQTTPSLVLLDEPTQGVDVGARQTVFRAIRDMADSGAAILCASSDYDQLAQICSRVLVFSRGRIVSDLAGEAVTKENIAEHCYRSLRSVLGRDSRRDVA